MRYLVAFLLFLNLAYFAWAINNPVVENKAALPPLADNVSKLVLLSERDPVLVSSEQSGQGEVIETPSNERELEKSCFTLGPLIDDKLKKVLENRLSELGFEYTSRSIEQRETTGYWVFLPPLENRKLALEVAEELARKGIKDYYVVTDEEYRHAVSLGLFSEKERANRRMAHIRTLGYKPQKIVRYRDRIYHWIDYEQISENPLPDTAWKDIGSSKEKIQKLDRSCN